MFTETQIDILRKETPGVANGIHLNNAGAALMPQAVMTAMQHHLELEGQIGGYEAAALRKEEVADFYSAVAESIGAQSHQIAYANSATDAYVKALTSIPFEEGDVILTTANDYVSNQIAFLQLERKKKVQVIRAADTVIGGVDCDSVEELVRQFKPKLVAVTHVPTNSGLVQPVETIGEICNDFEVVYLVDACQSVGQLKLDVTDIRCDFLSATFRKFLRGARGSGFLYVSDRILKSGFEPDFLDLHSANWLSPDHYEAAHDAKRFELWERSFAALLGSWVATRYFLGLNIEHIEGRVQKLATNLRERLNSIPQVTVLDRGDKLCGIVTFHVVGWDPARLKQMLNQHSLNASFAYANSALIDMQDKNVSWVCRFSPHYYNTMDEIEKSVAILMDILSK